MEMIIADQAAKIFGLDMILHSESTKTGKTWLLLSDSYLKLWGVIKPEQILTLGTEQWVKNLPILLADEEPLSIWGYCDQVVF